MNIDIDRLHNVIERRRANLPIKRNGGITTSMIAELFGSVFFDDEIIVRTIRRSDIDRIMKEILKLNDLMFNFNIRRHNAMYNCLIVDDTFIYFRVENEYAVGLGQAGSIFIY